MKRALCVWLPDWPIQRRIAAQPGLDGRPVLLHDPSADRDALAALADWSGRFSPSVAVEESPQPESLLLDITGLEPLFGGEAALAERIVGEFAGRGLRVRLAVADTVGAAWAAAHDGRGEGLGVRGEGLGARGNSNSGNANGSLQSAICSLQFAILPPGRALDVLRPLPVEALRLPEGIIEVLHQLGVRHIGQLEALPRNELSSRFGPELLRRWDQATGRLPEPIPVHRPAPEFRADWASEVPTTRRETLEAALEHVLSQVAARLVRSGRGVVRLECRLDCTSAGAPRSDPVRIAVGLFEPTASVRHLFQLAQMQLERIRLSGPVSGVHVAVTATAPLVRRQQELFSRDSGSRQLSSRQLALLVDRLSSRLGRRCVVRARLVADAQPELAWCYRPMIDHVRRSGSPRKAPADLPPRPLRLLPRPVVLAATSVMPEGPPLRFQLDGCQHRIARAWGPERIETGWWRGRTVGRDYYRVETTTGRRFWLFRRLRDARWFVHGMYE